MTDKTDGVAAGKGDTGRGGPNGAPSSRDVDPNQAPGGQNKPNAQGGLAGAETGDRNTSNHPGYVTNDTSGWNDSAVREDWAERSNGD